MPKLLWIGLLLLTGLSMLIMLLGLLGVPGWVFLNHAGQFFLGTNTSRETWQTDYVFFRRDRELLVSQRRDWLTLTENTHQWRYVQLTPLTPLFRWVTPIEPASPGFAALQPGAAPPPGYSQWMPVQKPAKEFSFDEDEQRQLDALKAAEQRCRAEWARFDSLLQRGEVHLTLPPITRRGANTAGCRFDGNVWCDFLPTFKAGRCQQHRTEAALEQGTSPRRHWVLHVSAFMRVGGKLSNLYLHLPGLHGPGVYVLGPDTTSPHTGEGPYLRISEQQPAPAGAPQNTLHTGYATTALRRTTVTITRFDTVARVVAGTFDGFLYDANTRRHLPLREGRFDVRYYCAHCRQGR
ncbi:hypothetical protein EJV47_08670 [Hymenobacter gummosus]|uniref:Uncharacterized protein n=1 Tax=Hymenobacter gummosus TaxID=1776032 RepID=A0A431U4C2_9BACT|nr:hypothetical protein [Hymenobacter gummosus]RTQ50696.1 hypothetical protein EJV47_08670 [Hymenobacter gummosus]